MQSRELAIPHASDMESLHSTDGSKEALSTTAEVLPSDWPGSCYDAEDALRIHLNMSLLSQVPRVDSR